MIYDGYRIGIPVGVRMEIRDEFKNPIFFANENYFIVLARYEPPVIGKSNTSLAFGVLTVAVFKFVEEEDAFLFERFIRFGHSKNTSDKLNRYYHNCALDFNYDICFDYNFSLLSNDPLAIFKGKKECTKEVTEQIIDHYHRESEKYAVENSFCLFLTDINLGYDKIKDIPNSQWEWFNYEAQKKNALRSREANDGYKSYGINMLSFDKENKDLELADAIHELIRYHFPPLECAFNTFDKKAAAAANSVKNYNKAIYEPALDKILAEKPIIKGI